MIRKLLLTADFLFLCKDSPFSGKISGKKMSVSTKIFCFCLLFLASFANAATRYSVTSGNWNAPATWSSTAGGGGGFSAPVAGDVVYIQNGHNITVTANAACGSLTFSGNTGTLAVNTGITLSISTTSGGTAILTLNSVAGANTSATISGAGTVNTVTLVVGTSITPSSSTITTLTSTISNFNISGDLDIISSRSGNRNNNSTFSQTSGNVTVGGTIDPTTANNNNNFAAITLGNSSPTLFLTGATPFGTTGNNGQFNTTLNGTGATVNYSRNGAQTALVTPYVNLTLSGSGLKTFASSPTVSGTVSMEGTATISVAPSYTGSATLQYNTSNSRTAGVEWVTPFTTSGGVVIANTGAITLNNAKTFNSGVPLTINSSATLATNNNALTFGGNFTRNGTFNAGSSNITIANNATQSIAGFTTTGNVSVTKGGGTATFTSAVSAVNFTVPSGPYLNLGAGLTHTASGTLTLTGSTVGTVAGSWGGSTSSATNINTSYFASSTGILNVGTSSCLSFASVSPITSVLINTLTKTTSASSVVGYEDFTAETGTSTTTLTTGLSYNLTVKGKTSDGGSNNDVNMYYTVFFDWNNNGYFGDTGENYSIGTIRNSNGTDGKVASIYVTIPTGATPGNIKMRIIGRYSDYNNTPCVTTGSTGQAEDYTVTILSGCSTPIPGDTKSTATSVCPSTPFKLSLENIMADAATYVWQTSPTGAAPWTNATPTPTDFYNSDFSTAQAANTTVGIQTLSGPDAVISNGVLVLTDVVQGGHNSGFFIDKSTGSNITPFTATFKYRIWDTTTGGSGADGMSLSYGPNFVGDNGGGENGEGSGLIIQFDTYDNEGVTQGSRVRILYGNVSYFTSAINAVPLRNSAYRDVVLSVDSNGLLSLSIAGITVVSRLSLPGYAADNKSNWKFKFSARTGGENDKHSIDDLVIKFLDVANSSSTYTTTQTAPTYYRAQVTCSGNIGYSNPVLVLVDQLIPTVGTITQPSCSSNTGSVVLSGLPSSGTWTLTRTPGAVTSTGTGTSTTITGLAANTTYTFTVNNGSCTSGATPNIVINPLPLTATWNAGWTNGLPTINQPVVFAGNYSSTADLNSCSCTINAGVSVVINSAHTLTVTNAVTVAGGANLTFENNASLVQTNNVTNSGNITYKRISPKIRLSDYTYWSSPVTPQTLYNVSQFTLADKYFSFNGNDWVMNPSNTVMQAGKGYIIRGPQTYSDTVGADYPASFVGVPNNGDITGETLQAGKFYLIGNPYPSAIGAFQFLDNNKFMDGTLYFWVHNIPLNPSAGQYEYKSDDYAAFNLTGGVSTYPAPSSTLPGSNNTGRPSGHIAAGQSFFASAAAAGTVHFINGMREGAADNTQFFKPGKTDKETAKETAKTASHIWLNMTNEGGAYKQMLVGYVDGATNDFETKFDGETFDAHPYLDFFSVNSNRTFVIQGRALPFEDTDVVPLGYRSSIAGEFTIAIDETDGELLNQAVYLEDKTTGKIHDLKAGKYTFTTAVGTFTDRLVLRYTNKTLGTGDFENTDNAIVVSVKTKVIKVTSAKENIKAVNIYDISGKLLYSKNKVNATELQTQNLQSANQVLLVKVTLDNDYTVTKKAIFQ